MEYAFLNVSAIKYHNCSIIREMNYNNQQSITKVTFGYVSALFLFYLVNFQMWADTCYRDKIINTVFHYKSSCCVQWWVTYHVGIRCAVLTQWGLNKMVNTFRKPFSGQNVFIFRRKLHVHSQGAISQEFNVVHVRTTNLQSIMIYSPIDQWINPDRKLDWLKIMSWM